VGRVSCSVCSVYRAVATSAACIAGSASPAAGPQSQSPSLASHLDWIAFARWNGRLICERAAGLLENRSHSEHCIGNWKPSSGVCSGSAPAPAPTPDLPALVLASWRVAAVPHFRPRFVSIAILMNRDNIRALCCQLPPTATPWSNFHQRAITLCAPCAD
jgi:hypothetical protein